MEQVCLVLPVQHGHADDARDFMRELEASRKPDYAHSEERIGITKEVWFRAATGGKDYELLVCLPEDVAVDIGDVTWIGTVEAGPAGLELTGAGARAASWRGHEHRF